MLFFIPYPNSAPPVLFTITLSKTVFLAQPTVPNALIQLLAPFAN
jgi:hypothetical protein